MRTAAALAAGILLLAAGRPAVAGISPIGPRDLLQVTVYQQPDLTLEVRVGDDGTVNLPLVGQVHPGGKSADEFSRELTTRYKVYLYDPQVNVFVKEYHKREIEVSVLGEVGRPGLYRFPEKSSLLDVISQVGGLTRESGERVIVLRPVKTGESRDADAVIINSQELFTPAGMQTQNIPLRDGDTVHVPRADHYFIFGEVRSPGSYKLEKGTSLTVLKAIILAGGFTDKAAKKGIRVTREEGSEKKVFRADLDTLLLSQDIIVVPESFF